MVEVSRVIDTMLRVLQLERIVPLRPIGTNSRVLVRTLDLELLLELASHSQHLLLQIHNTDGDVDDVLLFFIVCLSPCLVVKLQGEAVQALELYPFAQLVLILPGPVTCLDHL